MRFDRLTLRGVGPFTGEVTLDLQAIQGQLVAVCGDNGAGKSVLLEAGLAGACYRRTPTRGTLADLAVSRETMVEAHVTNGRSFVIRQTVDAHNGKGESVVLDAETGAPLVESGKRRDVDRWVAEHLPPAEVLYSSVFGAQGSGGFLDLDPAPRKAVIMRVLGHAHLEELSRSAGERARAAKGQLDTCLARLSDEKARGGDVGELENAAAMATARLQDAELEHQRAAEQLDKVREAAAEHERRLEAVKRWEEAQAARAARSADLEREIADLDVRRANNTQVIEQGAAIRDAAAELEGLAQQVADAKVVLAEAERVAQEAAQQAQQRRAERDQAERQRETAETTVRRLEGRLADRERVAEDAARVEACEAELAKAQAAVGEAKGEVDRLRTLQLDGKDQRIDGMRQGLEWVTLVPCDHDILEAQDGAHRTLDADDVLAESIAAVPELLRAAVMAERDARADLEAMEHSLRNAQQAADRLAELDQVAEDLEQARGSLRHWTEETERHTAEAARLEATAADARAAADTARPAIQAAEARHQRAAALARLLPRLEAAEARLEELDGQRDRLQVELDELKAKADSEPAPSRPGSAPDLVGAEAEVKAAERRVRESAAEAARATDALDRARQSAQRVEELGEERRRLEDELADWRLLERDLGRNGVQALELDAAGPELTELANDLLHSCLGARFSVRIESTRKSADGKRDLEGCWVFVHDAEANREAEAKTFSGGERVLVGEAVNLAITMLGVRHAGLTEPTIVRDETGAALDGEKGRAYVAMLRRAAQLVGASKVLFVSHAAELQELADSRVVVGEGRIEVG